MRTLNPYLVLIALLFSIISCTVDQEPVIENDSSNFIIETSNSDQASTQEGERFYNSQALSPESIELERIMQWASYISAVVLHTNSEAREHFVNQITPAPGPVAVNKPTISIKEVLGSDIPDTDPFKVAFKEYYIYYMSYALGCIDRPGGATETPPPGSNPPGTTSSLITVESLSNDSRSFNKSLVTAMDIDCEDPAVMDALAEEFVNTILIGCLELYFPNGIADTEYDTITSTAHPLSVLESSNTGYNHSYAGQTIIYDNLEVTVDQSYVSATNDPVVVVRPTKNRRCLYPQYNFDFTIFLQ